ncbi:hypothetical protein VUR80DRAFT_3839 [Thermomyces stellatus]
MLDSNRHGQLPLSIQEAYRTISATANRPHLVLCPFIRRARASSLLDDQKKSSEKSFRRYSRERRGYMNGVPNLETLKRSRYRRYMKNIIHNATHAFFLFFWVGAACIARSFLFHIPSHIMPIPNR